MLKQPFVWALLACQGVLSSAISSKPQKCSCVLTKTVSVFRDVTVTVWSTPTSHTTTSSSATVDMGSTQCSTPTINTDLSFSTSIVYASTLSTLTTTTDAPGSVYPPPQQSVSSATDVRPPPSVSKPPVSDTTTRPLPSHTCDSSSTQQNRYSMLYFGSWTIYTLAYNPQNLPTDKVSHLLYGFYNINDDGTVVSSDTFADYEKRFPSDSQLPGPADLVFGNIKQLYLHKLKNRNVKTLMSIGGWTYSQNGRFKKGTSTQEGRQRFASSAIEIMRDGGFDGIDVDWEYPETAEEAEWFIQLLKTCRKALDDYAAANNQNYHYLLTIAVSANPQKYALLDMASVDKYVDTWNLMGYDYAGSWDSTTGHAANLYASETNPESTKFNTDKAVRDYIDGGVPPNKIILGMPLYGRSFLATGNGIGKPYQGVSTDTGAEVGIWLYSDIPRAGDEVNVDPEAVGAWSYNTNTKELVSFDNVETAKTKAAYIANKGLGGVMFWEAAGDKTGEDSLVGTMAKELCGIGSGQNMIEYPNSRFVNIRSNME